MSEHQVTLDQAIKLALDLLKTKNFTETENVCQQILQHSPKQADAYQILGLTYKSSNQLEKAKTALEQAIQYNPNKSEYHSNYGVVLQELSLIPEAIIAYQKAICLKPDYTIAFHNMGLALQENHQYETARAAYRTAIALKPDFAEAYYNVGCLNHELRLFKEARTAYEKSVELDNEYIPAHRNLSMVTLALGDFKVGWKEYEWRLKTEELRGLEKSAKKPRWQGEFLHNKRILVRCEQGLGDTIQFVRFIPMIKQFGGIVIFECPKELICLFKNTQWIDRVVERTRKGVPAVDFDLYIPLLSLPGLFNVNAENIPYYEGYVSLDQQEVDMWKSQFGSQKKHVGIVWSGSPKHPKDCDRSCTIERFLKFKQFPNIQLHSLQIGDSAQQLDKVKNDIYIKRYDHRIKDFIHTASIIANLDLVITVDTSVAHLAGAMGKPTWLLISYVPDWRWLLDGNDSMWYKSVRLFRQTKLDDWDSVFNEVFVAFKESEFN
ncbi:MAG: tetratricopeptide repeat protein [Methylococcales bacterium]|jgi:Tfp pilus assembly protein PilF|nr:tetratricopeptide repeat protein [Methylococcales bacterium]MBT7409823.1 tetratricopeptide repeat protein [Methylococcales bacterium]